MRLLFLLFIKQNTEALCFIWLNVFGFDLSFLLALILQGFKKTIQKVTTFLKKFLLF